MTQRFLLILFLISTLAAKADYRMLSLHEMILEADKIVYGAITEVDSLSFTLNIEGNFTGSEKVLKIQKHQNWTCAWRWASYEVGQRLLLFLTERDGKLHQMGPGNESELPLSGDYAFIQRFAIGALPFDKDLKAETKRYIKPTKHNLCGKDFYGCKIELSKLIDAITTLRVCYEMRLEEDSKSKSYVLICDNQELKHNCQRNEIINWAVKRIEEK